MDYYLCVQVLLKRPICEQWSFPHCPNRMIAPQLLFAEPVNVREAAAELPAIPEQARLALPTADSAARPSPADAHRWLRARRATHPATRSRFRWVQSLLLASLPSCSYFSEQENRMGGREWLGMPDGMRV